MSSAGDPLGTGLVASLARPGGNITGLSMMVPELGGKRLQMLKEISPAVSRVAILWDAANPYPALVFKETESAARTLGIQLQSLEVRSPGDFLGAFDAAARQRAGALLTVEDPLTVGQRTQIVGFAEKSRLPAMYGLREFVDVGGLISYGVHLADLRRRAAGYVDKILLSGACTATHRHSPNVMIFRSSVSGPAGARLAPVDGRSWETMGKSKS
jgi:putative tryptophan/tyrosine transport system substrate-binding protein